jgi:hypothetical protein
MVKSKLEFAVVCDNAIFYFIIAHLHLQPNIHQSLWNLLDYNPIAMVQTFMEYLLSKADGRK